MTIERLPSGKYRITQMENGIRYRVMCDHHPTNAEAIRLLSPVIQKGKASTTNPTFSEAYERFIESKKNVISPSTVRGYASIFRNIPESFKVKRLARIASIDLQSLINDYARTHSAKSTKNLSALVLEVIRAYDYDVRSPKLPQAESKETYIPTREDISRILDAVESTPYEIPFRLATYGLRTSEITSLTPEDVDGCAVRITKAKVYGADHEWHTKGTKTRASTRTIFIDEDLAEKIRERGCIFDMHPATLNKVLYRTQDKLNIPRFSMHKFRHFFASTLAHNGISESQAKAFGGWSSDVIRRHYTHALEMDEAQRKIVGIISNL